MKRYNILIIIDIILIAIILIICLICAYEQYPTIIVDSPTLESESVSSTSYSSSSKVWIPSIMATSLNACAHPNSPFICGTPHLQEKSERENYTTSTPTTENFTETLASEIISTEPYYKVSAVERNALIHLLFFEACRCKTEEDILEQRAVISVVFNRFNSGKYAHCYDILDIIFFQYPSGSYAFSPAADANRFWHFKSPDEKASFERNYNQLAEKVDYVITHGSTVPSNVFYFVSNGCYKKNEYFQNNYIIYAIYDDTTFMIANPS